MRGGDLGYHEETLGFLSENVLSGHMGNKNMLLGRACRARLYCKLNMEDQAKAEFVLISRRDCQDTYTSLIIGLTSLPLGLKDIPTHLLPVLSCRT